MKYWTKLRLLQGPLWVQLKEIKCWQQFEFLRVFLLVTALMSKDPSRKYPRQNKKDFFIQLSWQPC